MKKYQIILFALLLMFGTFPATAQTNQGDPPVELDKWFIDTFYPGFPTFGNSKGYTQADLDTFREIFTRISTSPAQNDWEGVFGDDLIELGYSRFHFKSGVGFVSYYVYTCFPELRSLSYGNAVDTGDVIILTPFGPGSLMGKPLTTAIKKYVKVNWGDRQYLVEEKSLAAFAEKAAGIYVQDENARLENIYRWSNYWVRADEDKTPKGLPVFPIVYRHLERKPIKASIVFVGKPERVHDPEMNGPEYDNAVYPVTISSGSKLGVQVGMVFRIGNLGDEIKITQVSESKAFGKVIRSINSDGKEECYANFQPTSCRKLSVRKSASTIVGEFHW